MTAPASVPQRLRAAGFRLTIARIAVLQIVDACSEDSIRAEHVHQRMLTRGTRASIGTVYRVLHELEGAGLMLREWDRNRIGVYRARPEGEGAAFHQLVCRECGRSLAVRDGELHACLERLGLRLGGRFLGQALTIPVECGDCLVHGGQAQPGAGASHGGERSPVALQREAARKPPRAARASHLMGRRLTPAP